MDYLSFYISRAFIKAEARRKLVIAACAIGYLFFTLCFMFTKSGAMLVASSFLALLLFGYIGGFTHYAASLYLFKRSCTGRVIGMSLMIAIVLQFAVQNFLITDIALIAGAVADMEGRRLLPLCTLCMLVFSSVMALFLGEGRAASNGLYTSAVYLFSGFYVMYLTVTFLDAAPMTDKPDLYSGMGRISAACS